VSLLVYYQTSIPQSHHLRLWATPVVPPAGRSDLLVQLHEQGAASPVARLRPQSESLLSLPDLPWVAGLCFV